MQEPSKFDFAVHAAPETILLTACLYRQRAATSQLCSGRITGPG